jgi:carboxypeptidase C (cathepsin A)
MPQPPFRLKDNPYTPLDRSDLVLVDAIGTGWSRPADAAAARKYENPQGDVEAFGEFIRMYISRNERWSSPLYLFGESYGTTRSAGIAGYLQGRGIVFNGIGLLSMALNFQTLAFSASNDAPYPWNVPTYMAIAYYHHKLPPELQQAMDACQADPNAPCAPLLEAEQWAIGEYAPALARGDSMTAQQRQNVIDRLARYTGLRKDIIDQYNLRIDVGTFTHNLLLDQRLRVGRLDGRYALPEPDFPSGRSTPGFNDPASTATTGPFTMTFNNYMRTELNYKTDMPYYVSGRQSGMFLWSSSGTTAAPGGNQGFQESITPLRAAIVGNPFLKVLVMEGYYDLATPYPGRVHDARAQPAGEVPEQHQLRAVLVGAHGVPRAEVAREAAEGLGHVRRADERAVTYGFAKRVAFTDWMRMPHGCAASSSCARTRFAISPVSAFCASSSMSRRASVIMADR